MANAISVLLVEDTEQDAALIRRALKKSGLDVCIERVDSEESMLRALTTRRTDVVLADYQVPGFDAPRALAIAQRGAPAVPFIVVSGTMGEETAVRMMRAGADDYVLKSDLARLAPAISRELREASMRQWRRRAAQRTEAHDAVARLLARREMLDDAVAADVLSAIGRSLDLHVASLWQREERTRMRCRARWSIGDDVDLPVGAWDTREIATLLDPSGEMDPFRHELARGAGLRGAYAASIALDGEVIGVLEAFATEPDPWPDELRVTLGAIGREVAQFVRRGRALEALRASETRKAAMMEAALDAILVMDAQGTLVDLNPAAVATFGYTRGQAIGRELATLIIPARLRAKHREGIARLLATGVGPILGKRVEVPAIRRDGTELPVELTIVQLPGADPPMFTGFVRDITDRKRSEEIIRETQRYLEEGQAIAHVGSWVGGVRESDPMWLSAEACRIFGVQRAHRLSGQTILSRVDPADVARVRDAWNAALAGGAPFDIVHGLRRDDGSCAVVHARAVVVRDENDTPVRVVGTVQDVTESRRIEARDRFLAHSSAELTKLLEYPAILDVVARLGVPTFADGCIVRVCAEGTAERSAAAHHSPERLAFIRRVLAGERANESEMVQSSLCVPLFARGHEFGEVVFILDESDRRFDELDRATARDFAGRAAFAIDNARLYQEAQESIRARDEFLMIAAHELNTPLTPLRMQVQTFARRLERNELARDDVRDRLAAIDQATQRLAGLVTTLLDASHMAVDDLELHPQTTDLADVVRDVVERMRRDIESAGSDLSLRLDSAVGVWDRAYLERASERLVANAVKYGRGQPIEVLVDSTDEVARLCVRDHGPGIPEEQQDNLFKRFERRAPVRHFGGFGLGLWVARRIAEAHGGSIRLASRPGEGATFELILPKRSALSRPRGVPRHLQGIS